MNLFRRHPRPDPIQRHVDAALALASSPVSPARPHTPPGVYEALALAQSDLIAAQDWLKTTLQKLALRDEQVAYQRGLVAGLEQDKSHLTTALAEARVALTAARRTQAQIARTAITTPSVLCICGQVMEFGMVHICPLDAAPTRKAQAA